MFTALLIIVRAAHIAASLLIAGTFNFDVVVLGLAGPAVSNDLRDVERRLFRLAVWGLVAALLSAVVWFWLEVAGMTGSSLVNAFSTTAWQTVLRETEFGRVWQLRLSLIVAAFVFALPSSMHVEARRRSVILVLWFLSFVLLGSLAWISHAAAASVQPLGLFGDVLHLCAAGGWIGGLAPLVIFMRSRVSFSLGERFAPALERFSTLSLCCVSVLIVSGICNSWLLVGTIHALFTTPYGLLLLCKLTLFIILVGIGARNRLTIKTKLTAQSGSSLLPQLHRNVISEVCLGAAVVAIVGCLGATPPPGHR